MRSGDSYSPIATWSRQARLCMHVAVLVHATAANPAVLACAEAGLLLHASSSWACKFQLNGNASVHRAAGPTTCEAIFLNREELPCYPLYFDPVHDYGASP